MISHLSYFNEDLSEMCVYFLCVIHFIKVVFNRFSGTNRLLPPQTKAANENNKPLAEDSFMGYLKR